MIHPHRKNVKVGGIVRHTVAAPAVQSSKCKFGVGCNLDQSLAPKSKTARNVRLPHTLNRKGACESLLGCSASSCLGSKSMTSSRVSVLESQSPWYEPGGSLSKLGRMKEMAKLERLTAEGCHFLSIANGTLTADTVV